MTWPQAQGLDYHQDFFVGGWHRRRTIAFDWGQQPSEIDAALVRGQNWFIISNRSGLHGDRPGLASMADDPGDAAISAVAFRGYVLDPPIHSYSPSRDIVAYWRRRGGKEHNGVFAAACISEGGERLELISDPFGISPLYYRTQGDLVLFATSPRYLSAVEDRPDYLAWRCFIQSGFIASDRTLSQQIRRAPAGQVVDFDRDGMANRRWFDYEALPAGVRAVDDAAVAEAEKSFQSAMDRALRLHADVRLLPLTSGYDSRRILAGMIDRRVDFVAMTVEVPLGLNQAYREIDRRFAMVMARELGFPHTVVARASPRDYARNDRWRRILLDNESCQHTWAVPLMAGLPDRPSIIFDGLGGDALGESGFFIDGLHDAPESDRLLISHHSVSNDFDDVLSHEFPSAACVRDDLLRYIESLPDGRNQCELAFLRLKTRRNTALWAQNMIPAGHVVACPYMDIDHVRTMLEFDPVEKFRLPLPGECLRRFWPRYYAFHGSRRLPPNLPPGSPRYSRKVNAARFRALMHEIDDNDGTAALNALLSPKASRLLRLARRSNRIMLRSEWKFKVLLELIARQATIRPCWEIDDNV